MTTLRLVLGDQLTRELASLADINQAHDVVLMVEVHEEASYVRHHKQKLVLVFSAMRHFAAELAADGIRVDYVRLDDGGNSLSFTGEIERAIRRHKVSRLIVTEAGEWRVARMMQGWAKRFGMEVEIRGDDRFIASHDEFAAWAKDRRTLRMEFFYRDMRMKTGLLMEGSEPSGGTWNFDAENRKAWPKGLPVPDRLRFKPDAVTRDVMALVSQRYGDHFGDLEPFAWAVTRRDALAALTHFIDECLPRFGDHQDAMKAGASFLNHSLLSPYINLGLLTAREVCAAAQVAWRTGKAPLNSVEGFIRQIIGWREYVRGIYWHFMPDYPHSNALEATLPLPVFFWDGDTDMACLAEAISNTRRHAYAHHIERLMVIGNFALLAGIRPADIEEWFLIVYADAYEWVELPNVHGMAIFADGGVLASKPYAASGAYINRMSNHCKACRFDVKKRIGEDACPFNALYWDFLMRNRKTLARNRRMAMPYRNLERMSEEERKGLQVRARTLLDRFSL